MSMAVSTSVRVSIVVAVAIALLLWLGSRSQRSAVIELNSVQPASRELSTPQLSAPASTPTAVEYSSPAAERAPAAVREPSSSDDEAIERRRLRERLGRSIELMERAPRDSEAVAAPARDASDAPPAPTAPPDDPGRPAGTDGRTPEK
jgi:hypothetical protein